MLGQVQYLGRAPRTKETLPYFRELCWVTRHSRVFRGLTGSQRTPGNGASHTCTCSSIQVMSTFDFMDISTSKFSIVLSIHS